MYAETPDAVFSFQVLLTLTEFHNDKITACDNTALPEKGRYSSSEI